MKNRNFNKMMVGVFFIAFIGMLALYLPKEELRPPLLSQNEKNELKKTVKFTKEKLKKTDKVSNYKRVIPKKYYSLKQIGEIVSLSSDELEKNFFDLSRPKGEKSELKSLLSRPEWDLSQGPISDDDFHLLVNENKILLQNEISTLIKNKNYEKLQLVAAGYVALSIVDLYTLDEQSSSVEEMILIPPPSLVVKSKMHELDKKRVPAALSGLLELNKGDITFSKEEGEALEKAREEESNYSPRNSEGYEERLKYFTESDPVSDKVFDIIDFIIAQMTDLKISTFKQKSIHSNNLKMISSTLGDARKNPKKYGVLLKDIQDVTDLNYSIYADNIIKKNAIVFALIGGSLSALAGDLISKVMTKMRFAYALNALAAAGFDTLSTALGAYLGAKKLYVMHRYYSYMLGVKELSVYRRGVFDPKTVSLGFDPDTLFDDDIFRIEVKKSWAYGLFFGYMTKLVVSKKNISRVLESVVAKGYIGTKFFHVMTPRMAQSLGKMAKAKTLKHFLMRYFTTSMRNPGWFKYIMRFPVVGELLSFILSKSPVKIGLAAADGLLTTAVIYGVIYTKLKGTSRMLDKVYLSPGTNIQLSLLEERMSGLSFARQTRRIFYPLCRYVAENGQDFQHSTTFGDQKNPDDLMSEMRVSNCEKMITSFEGRRKDKVLDDFRKNKISEEEYEELLTEVYDSPPHFQVVWLAGLRSLFSRNLIPTIYWQTRNKAMVGSEDYSMLTELVRFNNQIPATLSNLHRLNYAIASIGKDIDKLKGLKNLRERENFVDSYISYFKYHYRASIKTVVELRKLDASLFKDEGVFAGMKSMTEDFVDQMVWVKNEHLKKPHEYSVTSIVKAEMERKIKRGRGRNDRR